MTQKVGVGKIDGDLNVSIKERGSEVSFVVEIVDADGNQIVDFASQARTDMEGGGKVSVGQTAVEVTFTGSTRSIIISADTSNTGTLYIGKSDVKSDGSNAVAPLEAGESLTIDYGDDSNAVYVVASIDSQNFWKGAVL